MGVGFRICGGKGRIIMEHYDIAVIGGGAAGAMAAIKAAEGSSKKIVLIERNDSIGKKILITGKGRCNITNAGDIEVFIKRFHSSGQFLRTAFFKFFNQDLIQFFETKGLELKTERQGRVFPVTDKAASVIAVLKDYLAENKVEILYKTRLKNIKKSGDLFSLELEDGKKIEAGKVVLATGGASYKITGSTGDGYTIAKALGHTIISLKPALVPLKTKETWVKDLQGIALENIRITFEYGAKKKIVSEIGELMFTHFGVSGPLVLDLSGDIVSILEHEKEIKLFIDLKPGLRDEQLDSKLVHKFKMKGNVQLKNLMKDMLPQRLIPVFIEVCGLRLEVRPNQITQAGRRSIVNGLKGFPLIITGALALEEAMVTGGGVSIEEINPRTMESKVVPGLYFAGEIIDGAASSGGYNLQQAFSTGYLAGESAANG